MSEDKKSFAERYMAFRKDISEMNWDADGMNTNQGYPYLSETKIKGQLAPALVKNDLGLKTDYNDLRILEPVGSMKQHYIVSVKVTIFDAEKGLGTDINTLGEKISFQAYGEGADSGDKAISKTQTNAFKNAIANNLLMSSYSVEGENAMESKASSNVNQDWGNKAVKQEAKEILQQTNPKTVNATATPTTKGINGVQANAMEKIMTKLRASDPAILEPLGGLTTIEIDYNAVKQKNDPLLAAKFIQKYKVVV